MKPVLLFASLFCLATVPALLAQSPAPEKEPVPEPPLMATAPADTQWTITYTLKTPLKEPTTPDEIRNQKIRLRYSPQLLAKRVVKGNGQMVIYNTYEAGLKSESWVVGGLLFDLPIYEGEIIRSRSISDGDFTEISWVKPENFRGTVDLKGRKVHLYETNGSGEGGSTSAEKAGQAKASAQRAYIDVKSRLPLAVDAGSTAWTYQYSAAPSTFPVPNPQIQKLLQDGGNKKTTAGR